MMTMKRDRITIQLIQDIPIDERHGLVSGRVLDAICLNPRSSEFPAWIVLSDMGERIGILRSEAVEV
jgi:hypothetical protein